MKRLIIILCVVLQGNLLLAQQEKRDIHQGNQLYQQQKYAEAEASYLKSVEKSKQSIKGNFNLGDAFYKQKKFDKAATQFNGIASSAPTASLKAQAYHNLGNTLMQSKKWEESVEAYKKSLLLNPKDDQTRYNLAYAMEKLKQQQSQDKKDQKNKDGQNKDQKKDQKNKDQKNQDKKDQKKDDKEKQDKDKNKDQQNKDQNKQDQNKQDQDKKDQQKDQKPQPDKLSKEDAQRMLEALNNQEKSTQDKLKNKKAKGVKGRIVKDW